MDHHDWNAKDKRDASELTEDEVSRLREIKTPEDITDVEVIDEWTDDHLPCIGVKINGVEIGLWWCDTTNAFHYWDSPKAKNDILGCIDNYLSSL